MAVPAGGRAVNLQRVTGAGRWRVVSRDKLSHFPLELRLNDCKRSYGRPPGGSPSHTHTHTRTDTCTPLPCQSAAAVILMEAEGCFSPSQLSAAACRERESLLAALIGSLARGSESGSRVERVIEVLTGPTLGITPH